MAECWFSGVGAATRDNTVGKRASAVALRTTTLLGAVCLAALFLALPAGANDARGRSAATGTGSNAPRTIGTCTDSWTGGAGSWTDGSDWSAGQPTTGTNAVVCITVPGSDVTAEGLDTEIGSLVLGGTSGATATLNLVGTDSAGTVLQFSGQSEIETTGVLDVSTGNDPSTSEATFTDASGSSASFTNDGLVETSGIDATLNTNYTNDTDGTVTIGGTTSAGNEPLSVVNDGTMDIDADATYSIEGGETFTQDGDLSNLGSVDLGGGQLDLNGGTETGNPLLLTGNETLDDAAGSASVTLQGENTLEGTIAKHQDVTLLSTEGVGTVTTLASSGVTNHGVLTLDVSYAGAPNDLAGTLTNDHTFDVESVGSGGQTAGVVNEADATMHVSGTGYTQNGPLTNDGTLSIEGTADLALNGQTLTEGSGATLGVAVAANAGSTITASESSVIKLKGTLEVTTTGKPTKNSTYVPISVPDSTIKGTFASLVFETVKYSVTYGTSAVTLTAK